MTITRRAHAVVACLLAPTLLGIQGGPVAAETPEPAGPVQAEVQADPVVRSVSVAGEGVATYPAYDPGTERYAVTTTSATGGTVTVTATTSDPTGQVRVDGRPAPGGVATVTGLTDGDEVAVWITDSGGTERHSYVYLPAGFPALERTTPAPAAGSVAPGQVMLTLSNQWFEAFPTFYETAVDVNGVPSWVLAQPERRSLDLQRQPNGHYTVARTVLPTTFAGDTIVELDEQFREVRSIRTVGLVNTDGHDTILEPDGTTWLMAYEPNSVTGMIDSVVQRLSPAGDVTFQWSSAGLEDESMFDGIDYAHANSMEVLPDGDLLVSFRNLSSVYRIDTSTPSGSIVWKLGGRDSDFRFVDEHGAADGGPCAQHTARLTPEGDVIVFDNGSGGAFERLCADPADPTGPSVARPQTRVATFRLDEEAGVATVIRSYAPPGRFAWFAGSSQLLPGGHTMVGWSSAALDAGHPQVATEIDASGQVVWELANRAPNQRFFTYRAHKADVPDATPPEIELTTPAAGATYVEGATVATDYRCTDRGGSSLQTCGAGRIDTSRPGRHSVRVTATDGAGLSTTVTRTYTVLRASSPRVEARRAPGSTWSDRLTTRLRRDGAVAVIRVRLRNDGARADRLSYAVDGRPGPGFRVVGQRRGGPVLLPAGRSKTVTLRVRSLADARPGDRVRLRIRTTSALSDRRDTATVVVLAAR